VKPGWRGALESAWYRGAPWLVALVPLSWFYRAFIGLRRWLYAAGVLRIYRAPVPVAVVGNITPGGTGKTEVIIALVEALHGRGVTVGVVSRGYGSAAGSAVHRVGEDSRVEDCGDEALLLFRRTGATVVTARSRAAAVRRLLEAERVDIILSDDGLQHYALARDLEVVLYDHHSGFGNGRCLPAGPLREPLSRLAGADSVLDRGPPGSGAQVWYDPVALVNLVSGERRTVEPGALEGEVCAVAGLGRPWQFLDTLAAAGIRAEPRFFDDHHRYQPADFTGLSGRPVIMTEKDAVKCAGPGFEPVLQNAWYLRVAAVLPDHLVHSVLSLARH
jgi:tetraacyldisaccharide 4'-kinase